MNGFLVIDKPGGMTSREAVNRVQEWFPRKTKIGHTGTLDPLATGVLVVCVSAATRLADYVQSMSKTYTSRFRLGATSSTDDADGEVTASVIEQPPAREQIERALGSLTGTIQQMPPAFSALKVSGRRAHELARKGEGVPLSARPVRIDAIRIVSYDWPFLDVEVMCGKGTYIRSIARDLGGMLGCGGMVETLRRTRVGPFTVEQGIGVEKPQKIELIPMLAAVRDLPQMAIDAETERRFRSGQAIPAQVRGLEGSEVAVVNATSELIGIAEKKREVLWPTLVLNSL